MIIETIDVNLQYPVDDGTGATDGIADIVGTVGTAVGDNVGDNVGTSVRIGS